ncbi:MAG TPA: FadR/GntR family transcriptional regulator [Thermomicrobiales bacterium]|nr:FadR/GntR family transcriptional regulator [Thermomicrobiales bacterium]
MELKQIDPIKREPVATQVARKLVEYLLSGAVEPGARMPSERKLAEAFGVGRSAMREAIKSLSLIGLVEVRQGDGTYLRKADSALLTEVIEWGLLLGERRTMDLVEARQELEIVLAGLAARRRTEQDIEDMRRSLQRMKQATAGSSFVEADVQFHMRLAEAAGNLALRDIHSSVQALLRTWIGRVLATPGSLEPSYLEHVPILDAIVAGDPRAAQGAMEAHMTSAAGRLRETLENEEPGTRN